MLSKRIKLGLACLFIFTLSACAKNKICTCTCTTTVSGQVVHTSQANVTGGKKDKESQCDNVQIEHDQLVQTTYPNSSSICEIEE